MVVVVAIVAALIFTFGPLLMPHGAEFTIIVHFRTSMDSGVPSGQDGPGTVNVTGNVTNIGGKTGTPLVKITVMTGYATEVFNVQLAPIIEGAHEVLEWEHHFDMVDPVNLKIECEVSVLST